jgi:hypothetical protein
LKRSFFDMAVTLTRLPANLTVLRIMEGPGCPDAVVLRGLRDCHRRCPELRRTTTFSFMLAASSSRIGDMRSRGPHQAPEIERARLGSLQHSAFEAGVGDVRRLCRRPAVIVLLFSPRYGNMPFRGGQMLGWISMDGRANVKASNGQ